MKSIVLEGVIMAMAVLAGLAITDNLTSVGAYLFAGAFGVAYGTARCLWRRRAPAKSSNG